MSKFTCFRDLKQQPAPKRISNLIVLASLGVVSLSIKGVSALDGDQLSQVVESQHKPPADEIKITAASQKYVNYRGNVFLQESESIAMKEQKQQHEVMLLSTLVAIFGVLLIALVAMISVYVWFDKQEEIKAMAANKDGPQIQMKNIQAAGKAAIISKLNKLQKSKGEEGSKLIKTPNSNRPSDLTMATNDDELEETMQDAKVSSPRLKNLGNPFTVKKLNCKVDDNDEEKGVSSPAKTTASSSASTPSITGPKMMRVQTGRTMGKYDRKEVTKPTTPSAKTMTAATNKTSSARKDRRWN